MEDLMEYSKVYNECPYQICHIWSQRGHFSLESGQEKVNENEPGQILMKIGVANLRGTRMLPTKFQATLLPENPN